MANPLSRTKATPIKETMPPPPTSPETARIFLLTGAEPAKKNAEVQRLVQKAVDDSFADFDVETMTGNTATAERILSAAGTVPLGEGSRVVVVRDTQQMESEEQKRLAAGLARIPQSGFLILHTGSPVIEDGKTKRGTTVEITLTNAVKKSGSCWISPRFAVKMPAHGRRAKHGGWEKPSPRTPPPFLPASPTTTWDASPPKSPKPPPMPVTRRPSPPPMWKPLFRAARTM